MKHNPARFLLPVLSTGVLILTSCGTSAKAASINELAPEVNTAVAETLTAEPTNTPTSYRNSNAHSHAYIDIRAVLLVRL